MNLTILWDILDALIELKNFLIRRVSKKPSYAYAKKGRLSDSRQDRTQFSERFLAYMDFNSILFSLEDASRCVKFVTNAPDATSVDPPYCNDSVEYDNSNETLTKFCMFIFL